jgi:hypothetical protein
MPPCNGSYAYLTFDEDTQKTTFGTSNNRCSQIQCQMNETCESGKCFNGVCLIKNQSYPTCNVTATYIVFDDSKMSDYTVDALNRCSGAICDKDD